MRTVILLLLCLLPLGCAPTRPPVLPAVAVTSELLLSRVQTLATTFDSLRGMAKIRIDTGGQAISGTQVLLAQKPDLLRAETLSPFGNPLLLVAINGKSLHVLLPTEGRFLRGEASADNIQRFTRLPLPLTGLVHLLLAQIPIISHRESQVVAEKDGFRLLLAGDDRQELVFDRELRLTRSSYYQRDVLQLRIDYDRFAGEPAFPHRLRLEIPVAESEATLIFSDVELNPTLSPERFILTPPPGYVVEPLP